MSSEVLFINIKMGLFMRKFFAFILVLGFAVVACNHPEPAATDETEVVAPEETTASPVETVDTTNQ